MGKKRVGTLTLMLLLIFSTFQSLQLSEVSAEPVKDSGKPGLNRRVDLIFTVNPNGRLRVEGLLVDTATTTYPQNYSLYETLRLNGNEESSNFTFTLPSETASEFPYNVTTISSIIEYSEDFVNTNFNLSLTLPEKLSSPLQVDHGDPIEYLLDSTDLTVDGTFRGEDAHFSAHLVARLNLTRIVSDLFNLTVPFSTPFSINLNCSEGWYEGLMTFHFLPGFPFGDVDLRIAGNLKDAWFNGTATVVYGEYYGMNLTEVGVKYIKHYLERDFDKVLQEVTDGEMKCPYGSLQLEDLTSNSEVIGSHVDFKMRIQATHSFVWTLVEMLMPFSGLEWGTLSPEFIWAFLTINEMLLNMQDGSLKVLYTPSDMLFDLKLSGTAQTSEIFEQVLELKTTPDEWLDKLPPTLGVAEIFGYEAWLALAAMNATLSSAGDAAVYMMYTHEERRVDFSLESVSKVETASDDLLFRGIILLVEKFLSSHNGDRWSRSHLMDIGGLNVTSYRGLLKYEAGRFNLLESSSFEDSNDAAEYLKEVLIRYLNDTCSLYGWNASCLDVTGLDIKGLKLSLTIGPEGLTARTEGLTIMPPVDWVNATAFRLYQFFNLSSSLEFQEGDVQLRVSVIGGSNTTHKVVLHNLSGVLETETVLLDAEGKTALMMWNNVTLSDLKELQFLIVPGVQVGGFISELETLNSESPFVMDASGSLSVILNVTGVSGEVAILISDLTAPVGVEPPPDTLRVMGRFVQIVSSNNSMEVDAIIGMYYIDEEVVELGIEEETLRIYRWNVTFREWVAVEPFYVNLLENYVWTYVDHFSIFALMGNMPPMKITLYTPVSSDIGQDFLTLTWSINEDPDFLRYEVYMSTTPGELGVSIANITDRKTVTYKVSGLSPGVTYYFTVRVFDNADLYTDSDQVSATTSLPIWMLLWVQVIIVAVVVAFVSGIILFTKKRRPPQG